MPEKRFIISGGGTGGHIFPALAIADELKSRYPKAQFLFVGARNRMEMHRVPAAGYAIEGLWISGIQRKLTLENLSFPLKLISSLLKCRKILRKFKPDAVIGTGGFASGPLLQVASTKGLPCLIQEQNSYPGITNKLLAKNARVICVAYPNMERFFPADKIVLTGNPIRKSIGKLIEPKAAKKEFKLNENRPTLLVLGGSLGSKIINQLISEALPIILAKEVNLIWQCGKYYLKELQEKHPELDEAQVLLTDFLTDMNTAFSAANVVISRAGAGTLSELAVVAKASILIPSPNVAEDHQTKNAQALESRQAAILFREENSAEELSSLIISLIDDPAKRQELEKNIAKMALPQATENIVDEIEKLLPL